MYKIYINQLKIMAIIGILDHERLQSQSIIVDCEIQYNKSQNEFINYAEVVNLIEMLLVSKKYFLLEDALDNIIKEIKDKFNTIKSIKLKLSKPEILPNCIVAVENFKKY